ncbi:tetratricopeptide repeat protein [Streptomyces synnematoformans]|uniref:Tetratricopeptide repeat protein n=1 Tax=Streptomyces synnematoformans TaxID=415721 RepID=A0ABN2Y8E4_9ACTN
MTDGSGGRVHGDAGHVSRNEVDGTVRGTVVQAGAVHGDVHFHTRAPAQAVPWQLPPAARIIGRTAEMAALEASRVRGLRAGRGTLAAVSGLGGVGKTAVALSWLHGLRREYPDGQLYADLGAHSPAGPADPGGVVAGFLRALGVAPEHVPRTFAERVALYRSLTGERRLVVLLDDAASAGQVRSLQGTGPSLVVVTSRRRLAGLVVDGGTALNLEPLADDAAVELLGATLADGRVADQPEAAHSLVELCAGLPLAVRVIGARLAARPRRGLATMQRALAEERNRLAEMSIPGDDHDVRASLDVSYRGLPTRAARLYRLLGVHPGPEFSGTAASAALGEEAEGPLGELLDANLLTEVGEDRHRLHDLVRLHASDTAAAREPGPELAAALRRVTDHYLAGATRAEEVVDPQHRTLPRDYGPGPYFAPYVGDDPATALDWLDRELTNLMAVIRGARPSGVPTAAWQTADALWPLFLRRKSYQHGRTAHAEGLTAARELGDVAAQCRMLTSGGLVELDAGGHASALRMFEEAARLFRGVGDALGHARTLNYRGLAHQRLGEPERAATLFGRAAEELPAAGDVRAGGLARLNLADVALADGHPETATEHAEAALAVLRDAGDAYNAARARTLLGYAFLERGLPDRAEEHLTTALAELRRSGADYETARAVEGTAALAEHRGAREPARTRYREALDLYVTSGGSDSPRAEAVRERLRRLEDD